MNPPVPSMSAFAQLARELKQQVESVRCDVPLSAISRWRIGGPAAVYVEPATSVEAGNVMRTVSERGLPLFIMGDSSNTLFDSAGFNGVVVRIGRKMSEMRIKETEVWAQAGIWVPRLVATVGRSGLTGIEHAIGIPGTLGGLILMNGGSQRKGIGQHVVEIVAADAHGEIFRLKRDQCGFAYRKSALQGQRVVILEATIRLEPGNAASIRREMLEIMRSRRKKFPHRLPNCGSTFLSDPEMYKTVGPPGHAIEQVGLKGLKKGGAQISPMHANFIVNNGGATSDDVLWLIAEARRKVLDSTGYTMDCEVCHLSQDGILRPAHVSAEKVSTASDLRGTYE